MKKTIKTKSDGLRAAQAAITNYKEQRNDYEVERKHLHDDNAAIEKEFKAVIETLVAELLPTSERPVVEQAAQEIGATALVERLNELEKEHQSYLAHMTAVEADTEYINREALIDPVRGEYPRKIGEAEAAIQTTRSRLKKFDFPEFHQLYDSGYHQEPQYTFFQQVKRAITLADHREGKRLEVALTKLGYPDFKLCVEDYEALKKRLADHEQALNTWQEKQKTLIDLIEDYEDIAQWVANYQEAYLRELRLTLSNYLTHCNYHILHQRIRPQAKVLVAQGDALRKKLAYFKDITRFLEAEIDDRDSRIRSIDRVRAKWAVKPYGPLGNKTKWLVTVPTMKRESTQKRLGWTRTMRSNIRTYNDYDRYSYFMDLDDDWDDDDWDEEATSATFLAYDLFAYLAEARMPYEGFTRTIIRELDEFRQQHNMERADYTMFKDYSPGEDHDIEDLIDAEAEAEMLEPYEEIEAEESVAEEAIEAGIEMETAAAAAALIEAEDMMGDTLADFS